MKEPRLINPWWEADERDPPIKEVRLRTRREEHPRRRASDRDLATLTIDEPAMAHDSTMMPMPKDSTPKP